MERLTVIRAFLLVVALGLAGCASVPDSPRVHVPSHCEGALLPCFQ